MNLFLIFLIFVVESSISIKRARPRTGYDEIFGNHDDQDHYSGRFTKLYSDSANLLVV